MRTQVLCGSPKYTLKNRSSSDSTIALYNYISKYANNTKKTLPPKLPSDKQIDDLKEIWGSAIKERI